MSLTCCRSCAARPLAGPIPAAVEELTAKSVACSTITDSSKRARLSWHRDRKDHNSDVPVIALYASGEAFVEAGVLSCSWGGVAIGWFNHWKVVIPWESRFKLLNTIVFIMFISITGFTDRLTHMAQFHSPWLCGTWQRISYVHWVHDMRQVRLGKDYPCILQAR
jgi:hypothetical protein